MKQLFGREQSIKLLVIEDDPSLSEILEELFVGQGYDLKIFPDTEDILPLVDDFRPDLVLLDYMLPRVNGGELCSQIKRRKSTYNVPVIIYSAFPKVLLSLGDYGCDAFIAKPFDLEHLIHQIEKLIASYKRAA